MHELHGTTQVIQVGKSFTFALNEGAATPYLWAIEYISNPDLIQIATQYVPAQSNALGATGHKVFTITALGKGHTSIHLKHWDQWQNHIQETLEISVNIE